MPLGQDNLADTQLMMKNECSRSWMSRRQGDMPNGTEHCSPKRQNLRLTLCGKCCEVTAFNFSEGGVGKEYLHKRGVPENALIAETQGSDTSESAQRVAVIMRANGLHSCIAVSDAYHVFRIRKLLEHEGIGPVYVAPRADSRPHGTVQRMTAALREATSYLLWRLGIT